MENKIIMVDLNADFPKACAVQYDYGQTLRIQGGTLQKAVEVHFSLDETGGESITRIGTTKDGVTEAPVPDSMLENNDCEQNYSFYAYVYVRDDTSGNTKHKITIHVKARSKPEIPGDIEEPELFGEVMKTVNEAADRAEAAEEKAKASAEEAGNYAKSASESAAIAEQTKEAALEEIGEKQQEAISSIQQREKASVDSVTTHTDNEIQRIQEESSESEKALRQTINDASTKNEKLGESIQTADTTKTELDKSTELAGDAKTELDTSIRNAGTAKTALDTSISEATAQKQALDTTVEQAGEVNTSLSEKISDAGQILNSVAQIETNTEDIGSLKEEMSRNVLNDAKTKRSLEALWKLNRGISYQFETDAEKAYQKDVSSGAKLANVKRIGGRTIVWNQLVPDEQINISTTLSSDVSVNTWGSYITTINNLIENHTVYAYCSTSSAKVTVAWGEQTNSFITGKGVVETNDVSGIYTITKTTTGSGGIHWRFLAGAEAGTYTASINLVDLTRMFGAGNEPETVEEFKSMFPSDYYEYDKGTLLSMPVNEVVEQGKNLCPVGNVSGTYTTDVFPVSVHGGGEALCII